jgi:hypothetical protein
MTPPQSLTWAHLLPSGLRWDGAGAPDWFVAPLRGADGTNGARAVVAWEQDGSSLPSMDAVDALAAVNCRGIGAAKLSAAGFNYVRRFAVLPSLRNARWYVPLGRPSVSSAAFDLYSPARTRARLQRSLVRLAVHTRLPVWYRDEICIALRRPPPLEAAVRELFPTLDLRIALSSGAPDGARNRKASAAVIDPGGKVLAFLKLGRSDLARRRLRHEAAALEAMASKGIARGRVPKLLLAADVDGTFVTAQTPVMGKSPSSEFGRPHQRFLDSLKVAVPQPAATISFVRELAERVGALPTEQAQLTASLDGVAPELDRLQTAPTIIHGDFAPWNLRRQHDEIVAFDWEYAHLEGIPGIDALHYLLQTGYLLHHWSPDKAYGRMRHVAPPPVQVVYLVDHLARLFDEGYDDSNEMVKWLRQLLGHAAAHRREAAVL